MKAKTQYGMTAAAMAMMCLGIVACGSGVKGHTYADSDGTEKIEFQSGGKAIVTMISVTANCTYAESSSKVDVTCGGQVMELTVGSDGSLTGPPGGVLDKLTKVN